MLGHVAPHLSPDGEERALPLMVTRPVGVGFPEVAGDDRTIDCSDNLSERQAVGRAGQQVAPTNSPFGDDDSGPL